MSFYDHQQVEQKWQKRWVESNLYSTPRFLRRRRKRYILDMFPYPSSAGLHVGHPEGYTATDITARYWRLKGDDVLHPMGWDAFGLPAENFAIKSGVHPAQTTAESINNFRRQIQALGLSYDWAREINTSSPEYYKWTQWFFLFLYKHNLAYKKQSAVNWCESCQTVLANEQVVDGRCERCKNQVIQKNLEQWFFKITDYAERLLKDLDKIDWPESIKTMQKNWIGKSTGAEIDFKIQNSEFSIKVFTTRPDTIFGATYMVIAPEHEIVKKLQSQITNWPEVEKYILSATKKSELERAELQKEKTGVELKGLMAVNPANQKPLPIFMADYVLTSYGTGAIMAVPAHDQRDWEFAKKFDLPIIEVISGGDSSQSAYVGDGALLNSGEFNGLDSEKAKEKIINKFGFVKKTNYKLRDWLVSRQRYWGAPIPIIYCETCGQQPVAEKDLPVVLPTDVDFRPTGQSPLVDSQTFHNVRCPKCKKPARRESDTMDTFVCSSWYYLRFADPHNSKKFAASRQLKKWLPVDLYVGGAEHAVLHLMYARFFTKVLFDHGYIKFDEPFNKLRNQGMILGEDGEKMSKSRGNVINPDEVVEQFGADSLRLYEMFMGPLEDTKPWNTNSISGVRRFLDKVYRLSEKISAGDDGQKKLVHKTIKKVSADIENMKFNTAISALMILTNELEKLSAVSRDHYEKSVVLLSPFAPHIAEELWEKLGHKKSIFQHRWPDYDKKLVVDDQVTISVQVNGKLRGTLSVEVDSDQQQVENLVQTDQKLKNWLAKGEIKKVIFVPNKLINFVVV